MNYYDDPKNIERYVQMAEGYDGRTLIEVLKTYLPPTATILELGMGPGTDLDILQAYFSKVIGSDYSQVFLDRYRQMHPNADLLQLDAANLNLDHRFDAIYSNKVLHCLSREELKNSLDTQAQSLNSNGILFHSMWYGTHEEAHAGMHAIYYTEETLRESLAENLTILNFQRYTEMEENDSFYVILQPKLS